MAAVVALILPLFGLILLGFITAKLVRQPAQAMGWLNIFIVYLALPALFFKLLSKTPVEELASWGFVSTNVASTYAVFGLVFAFALLIRRASLPDATLQGLASSYGNIGYMGPALAITVFGERAAVPVALIFCFENLVHFSITPTLMAVAGKSREAPAVLIIKIAKSILFHPFIIATAAGVAVAVSGVTTPLAVENLIDNLAQAAAPSALFAMGVTLALGSLRRVPTELVFIVPVKLILHPVAMYVFLSLAGDFDPVWVMTAVLLAALPTATNVFVLAQQYDHWVNRASACILITTVLSALSVGLLIFGITEGLIPSDLFPSS